MARSKIFFSNSSLRISPLKPETAADLESIIPPGFAPSLLVNNNNSSSIMAFNNNFNYIP